MARTWTHRKACRLCNSRHVVPVVKFASTPPEALDAAAETTVPREAVASGNAKVPLILALCEKCQLVQSLDVVHPPLLFDHHPCRETTDDLRAFYRTLAESVISSGDLRRGDLVVDIGSGSNLLLELLREMGMKTVGVDPSDQSAALAATAGISHYREFFSPAVASRIHKEHGPASAVIATFTLGSIDNLHAVCAGIRFFLKPGGIFHFVEPQLGGLIRPVALNLIHHERISVFGVGPLDNFFKDVHLHLFDMRTLPNQPFLMHGLVQRSDGMHVTHARINQLISEERSSGLASVQALNTFAAAAEDRKSTARKAVEAAIAGGRIVAGCGANSSAVTLIHEFGWNNQVLRGVIQSGHPTTRSNIPGTDIPLISWDDAKTAHVGAIIVFGDPLIDGRPHDRIQSFKASGGLVITLD